MDAEGSAPRPFALPRAARITQSGEIRELFRRGKRRKTRHLDAFVSPSPSAFPRWGVVVPKHRHEIVERNRVKRRLRHLCAQRVDRLPAGSTLVVRALPSAATASSTVLGAELDKGLERVTR
jgi:ribonuclease P protein component